MRNYRGKRKDNGEEVKGWYWLHKTYGTHYIRLFTRAEDEDGRFSALFDYEVIPATVGQSTGLKETCSGDVITFLPKDYSTKIKQKAVVEYCEKRACFIAHSDAWLIPLHSCRNIEIIGNIHDNPEMLC